ncbi:hypothetical protein J5N97_006723 [Dioscorea zingiberensis]|uniref:Uncharacterized protein n=1 Tax=Dioscorea zingiberensis TaxID=325984 RepID=A0A9D5HUA2_9LILI|nr:hypothetical protein J5N97_006723 [Dioscorea zingiberensis]
MELYFGHLEENLSHFKHSPNIMNSVSTQFATSGRMGIYEPYYHMNIRSDSFKADSSQNTSTSTIVESNVKFSNKLEDIPHGTFEHENKYEHESDKHTDKVLRRLAQNREAARKSRLRKKAYVQQLESSRIRLIQLEQELEQARRQGLYLGGHSREPSHRLSGNVCSEIVAFEMEYGHWVEEQNRQTHELRSALQAHVPDIELKILVDSGLRHYDDLFRIKAIATKADVFYIMSGMWRTATERFFLWIGGFRPSDLLKVLTPQLDPLTDPQLVAVYSLQQSSQQAEDALSQGLNKLQQTLAEALIADPIGTSEMSYMGQMTNAMEKLEALVSFVSQADHLQQQTLQQMHTILTPRQAARGLLALGDYFHRLRTLSSLWAACPREPT